MQGAKEAFRLAASKHDAKDIIRHHLAGVYRKPPKLLSEFVAMINRSLVPVLLLLACIVELDESAPMAWWPPDSPNWLEKVQADWAERGQEGAAKRAFTELFVRRKKLLKEVALAHLLTLASSTSQQLNLGAPLELDELLSYAEARDENCGNEVHEQRLRQLIAKSRVQYKGLHNYLRSAFAKHRMLCRTHPKQVLTNFRANHEHEWELVVELVKEAKERGFVENDMGRDNRQRLRDALTALVEREFERRQLGTKSMSSGVLGGKELALAREVSQACQKFVDEFGWAVRLADKRPRANVTADEMLDWLYHLIVCNPVKKVAEES